MNINNCFLLFVHHGLDFFSFAASWSQIPSILNCVHHAACTIHGHSSSISAHLKTHINTLMGQSYDCCHSTSPWHPNSPSTDLPQTPNLTLLYTSANLENSTSPLTLVSSTILFLQLPQSSWTLQPPNYRMTSRYKLS